MSIRVARAVASVLALGAACAGGCRTEDPPAARMARVSQSAAVRLGHGEIVPLTFDWTPLLPLRPPGVHPTVFVHLIDRPNHVIRTFDHDLAGPWTVGETRRDEFNLFQSALGAPLPAGTYTLTAGLYDPALGYRWRLTTDGRDVTGHREYSVAEVRVPPGRSGDVKIRFTGGWSAVEAGVDRQVLQRRWLTGSGSIWIDRSAGERTIGLELRVLGDGGVRARIASTCSVSASTIPAGARWIEAGSAAGEPCEIRLGRLGPNTSAAPPVRWLAVEVLGWRPHRS